MLLPDRRVYEGFNNMKEGTLGVEGGPGAQLQPSMDEPIALETSLLLYKRAYASYRVPYNLID